jgi:hypothetical protein
MRDDFCHRCRGELVTCDCEPEYDDRDGPADVDYEEINDRSVVWVVGDNGVGRVEVQR